MRQISLDVGEHYHVYARGTRGMAIFHNDRDRARLLFLLLTMQSEYTTQQVRLLEDIFSVDGWGGLEQKTNLGRKPNFSEEELLRTIVARRRVSLVNFALMPNHLHLTVHVEEEQGLSRYLQKTLNAYAKYFNTKHKLVGHLFQGPFGAVHVEGNDQLLHLSAYVHKNPTALAGWRKESEKYPWSSFTDYVHKNRWGELLDTDVILKQFRKKDEYLKFVRTSSAKELLDPELFIDVN